MIERSIQNRSDPAIYKANCEAIDRLIGRCRYPYVVAWGKFLGAPPETVRQWVRQAEAGDAPADAIQYFRDGLGEGWGTVDSIRNDTNRRLVIALANVADGDTMAANLGAD
ncbi:MAG TPA: hypothetical protein VJ783_24025 [Pirellulales bacterium]|nr:hypothetical protein [Pirellulales bacterium]